MADYNENLEDLYDDNNYDNNYDDDYNDDYDGSGRNVKILKILVAVLAIVLVAITVVYFSQVKQIRSEFAIERDTLTNQINNLLIDYDNLTTENDSISRNLLTEREKADSLLTQLKNERSLSYSKMQRYEKELGTLRTVMRNYVHQIDSLNQLNQKLSQENVTIRKQVSTERLRADKAEELTQELNNKLKIGSVVRARDIELVALTSRDKEVDRASRAARLRADFVLSSNDLTEPGAREVYVRITAPDGFVLANSSGAMLDFEGSMITYTANREVDYQNKDLSVSIFYTGAEFSAGKYKINIYMDGRMIGENEFALK
ncbi:MAG: hypothetical protein R3Y15_00235 [Rikenellaceae bacterium]